MCKSDIRLRTVIVIGVGGSEGRRVQVNRNNCIALNGGGAAAPNR